jgi:hypothetical protein
MTKHSLYIHDIGTTEQSPFDFLRRDGRMTWCPFATPLITQRRVDPLNPQSKVETEQVRPYCGSWCSQFNVHIQFNRFENSTDIFFERSITTCHATIILESYHGEEGEAPSQVLDQIDPNRREVSADRAAGGSEEPVQSTGTDQAQSNN